MGLRTYSDWQNAVASARVVYNHSQARIVSRARKVKKSRKIAFLSAMSGAKMAATRITETSSTRRKKTPASKDDIVHSSRTRESSKTQIFINTSFATPQCLQLDATTSVRVLKEFLQDRLGVPTEKQHLVTKKGLELCDALSLADHSIDQDSNIDLYLTSGLGGGRKKRGKKRLNSADESSKTPDAAPTSEKEEPSCQGAMASIPRQRPGQPITADESHQQAITDQSDTDGAALASKAKEEPFCQGAMASIPTQRPGQPITADESHQPAITDQSDTDGISNIPEQMCSWTKDDLRNWLLSNDIPPKIAVQLYGEEVTGKVLHGCDMEDLTSLGLKRGHALQILQCKRKWINSEGRPKIERKKKSRRKKTSVDQENESEQGVQEIDKGSPKVNTSSGNVTDCTSVINNINNVRIEGTKNVINFGNIENSRFFDTGLQADVLRNGKDDQDKMKGLLANLYELVETHGVEHMKQLFNDFWGLFDVQLNKAEEGSLRLTIGVKSRAGLDNLWSVYTSGDLAKRLAKILISDVLGEDDNSKLTIQVTIQESAYQEGCRFFDDMRKELPELMKDWSKDHLRNWLLCIGGRSHFAEQLYSGYVNGNLFRMYKEEDLASGETSPEELSLILKARDSWLLSEDEKEQEKMKEDSSSGLSPSIPSPSPALLQAAQQTSVRPKTKTRGMSAMKSMTTRTDTIPSLDGLHGEEPEMDQPETEAMSNLRDAELRLRKLLTGDEYGEIDKSLYPVLVANKVPESNGQSDDDILREQFGFVKTIRWVSVLDFDSKSLCDGLCKLYHKDRLVTLQQPELFQNIKPEEEFRNSIEFPEKTLWIFANGREDNEHLVRPKMTLQEWHRERRSDVEAAISFFSQPSVIPSGRAMVVFLLSSDSEDDIDIICDTFGKLTSSFQGLQNVTCIVEDPAIYSKFVDQVGRWFSKKEIDERSIVGFKWRDINRIVMGMHDVHQIGKNELPLGGQQRASCYVSEKLKDEWDDISIVCKNECENTNLNESSPGYRKFKEKKELNFYHGQKVDWWNFALNDREVRDGGLGHVLKRDGYGKTLSIVTKYLQSSKCGSVIVTVTLLHQPGAGGSTLSRHILWELHRSYRCIVVKRITVNTVNQIMVARRHGYTAEQTRSIPPVCVLLDDFDDVEVLHFIGELEETSRDINLDGGAVCVLLNCKRHSDPMSMMKQDKHKDLYIPLTQKLEQRERKWLQKKYQELERKESENQTGEFNPDNLLAFMVMKKEFDKEFIKTVVSRILHNEDMKTKEFELIKYCAFLNAYLPEAEIPISCCDRFMIDDPKHKVKQPSLFAGDKRSNWEKTVSASFKILVLITENRTIKVIHKSISKELLKQTLELNGDQSLVEVTLEFLGSKLLRSDSYSLRDLRRTTHDVLIRRTRIGPEDSTKTDFSNLIEEVCKNSEDDPQQAIEILRVGFETLGDAFVAQQLARLYLREKQFELALTFAKKAIEIDPKRHHFCDTKGRVFQKHAQSLSAPFVSERQEMRGDKLNQFISLSVQAMEAFRDSFQASINARQIEYTGLYAEFQVAFHLLQVVYFCVEPFRTSGNIDYLRKYLLVMPAKTTGRPVWNKDCQDHIGKLKNQLEARLELMDDHLTIYKDGSSANIAGQKLDGLKDNLKRYMKDYEYYYGQPSVKKEPSADVHPRNAAENNRRRVIELRCSRFSEIFQRNVDITHLQKSRQLLLENCKSGGNRFDFKTLIAIYLVLSARGETLDKTANEVYEQLVRPLHLDDEGEDCWAPFYMMMFLWPIPNTRSERRDRETFNIHVKTLQDRWNNSYKSPESNFPRPGRNIRHSRFQMKPRTHFFLGTGEDLRIFVHINELLSTQSQFEKTGGDDEFWRSSALKDRLQRLEGLLIDNTTLVYRPQNGKDEIRIKLGLPWRNKVLSQEPVTFYVGFSWNGPLAYRVIPKGSDDVDTKPNDFSSAYPDVILPSITAKKANQQSGSRILRLQEKRERLVKKISKLLGDRTKVPQHTIEQMKKDLDDIQIELMAASKTDDDAHDVDIFLWSGESVR